MPTTRSADDVLRAAANQMLARIEELMANLQHVTSDIAHDLRTPLGRLRQRLDRRLLMAGLQVSINGRFWVSTEDVSHFETTHEPRGKR